MNSSASKLSPLQLELLKIYSFNPSEEELQELKNLLAQFFAERFTKKVAHAAKEKNITDSDLDSWLEEDEQ
ncbi:MAG: hypothetical protein H6557_15025 [Lewinellaceae bacterium]|nr:hypothetical protein [Phaeodactylibacter sp.]MCB9037926.1 hypothetical protein [Lewinellaceae bacterium]